VLSQLNFIEVKMYAIIETGGKQYRVQKDEVIDVELLNAQVGKDVEFTNVLLHNDGTTTRVGVPFISNARVLGELITTEGPDGEVINFVKGPKVVSFKYKQRKNIRRKVGHRQKYSRVRITEIVG
jgi:large subunit ribosomal protein L21